MKSPCFMCYLENFSREKITDEDFFFERKNEFYPDEEFGEFVEICDFHAGVIACFRKMGGYEDYIDKIKQEFDE